MPWKNEDNDIFINISYVYLNSSILSLYFKNKEDKMINIEQFNKEIN